MKQCKSLIILISMVILFLLLFVISCDDESSFIPGGSLNYITQTFGDDALASSEFTEYETIFLSLSGLAPNYHANIKVTDNNNQIIGEYLWKVDRSGNHPAAPVIYDAHIGEYTINIDDQKELSVNVSESLTNTPFFYVCGDDGNHRNNFEIGSSVYVKGEHFTARTVKIWVCENRYDWQFGDYLFDYSEKVEQASISYSNDLEITNIWDYASNNKSVAFDIVIDMNENGIFDPGDLIDGNLGVGFVVQDAALFGRMVDGHIIEKLSCGDDYVYRDIFTTDESVFAYLNPKAKLINYGDDRYVNWYVTNHHESWYDGDSLVSVDYENMDCVQKGSTSLGLRMLWTGQLTPGSYDIIIDVNRNGKYDKGIDILDGDSGTENSIGFSVINAQEPKEWTILVYADGENGLSTYQSDFAQGIANAMGNNIYAAVLFDGDNEAGFEQTERYICSSGGNVTLDHDFIELNMGDPNTLQDFITWGITKFPANHYMVVLSGHGGSWLPEEEVTDNKSGNSVCPDGSDALNLNELNTVFRNIKNNLDDKLDILWYQAGTMAAVEAASVSKNTFDYMVAHETIRADSENNDKFRYLVNYIDEGNSVEDIAKYAVTCSPAPSQTFCAAYDLSLYETLENYIKTFVDLTISNQMEGYQGEIHSIISESRSLFPPSEIEYPVNTNKDMYDFFNRISTSSSEIIPLDVKEAAERIVNTLDNFIIQSYGGTGVTDGLYGISAWLPSSGLDYNRYRQIYSGFDFSSNTNWSSMLEQVFKYKILLELNWGSEPHDLDCHLFDDNTGSHIFFNCKSCIDGAFLDTDDISGFGPENIRISTFNSPDSGKYEFWVHLYEGDFSQEPSTAAIYRDSQVEPVYVYDHVWNDDTLLWWHVYDIDKATRNITVVDSARTVGPYTPDVNSNMYYMKK